jgi:nucleoid DNA-binding protein
MKIADLIAELSQRDFTPTEAELIVTSTFDVVTCVLRKGQNFTIRDFGCFSTEPPRPRRKPRLGDSQPSAPTRVLSFHPGKKLKSFPPKDRE